MKKIISVFLVLGMLAGFAACITTPDNENPFEPVITDENGNTLPNTDPNIVEITVPDKIITEAPTEEDTMPSTTQAASKSNSETTTGTTKATQAKATLYPNSTLYKNIKSQKFYLEALFTEYDKNGTQQSKISVVRARDKDKQYVRFVSDNTTAALYTDDKGMNMILPASTLSGTLTGDESDSSLIQSIKGTLGSNLGFVLPIQEWIEASGDYGGDDISGFFSEMNSMFDEIDDVFLNTGKFQGSSTASLGDQKFNVEIFKIKNSDSLIRFYFPEGKKDTTLAKITKDDGSYKMISITVLKDKAEDKYFNVPKGYTKLTVDMAKLGGFA